MSIESKRALAAFGHDNQVLQFISELMEAGKTAHDFQFRKSVTRHDLARELCDVEICLCQMRLLVGLDAMEAARIEKREKFMQHLEQQEAKVHS